MSESKQNINSLYAIVLRETQNDTIQEVNPHLYTTISESIGNLRSEEYDGVEDRIKDSLINIMTQLTTLLLKTRLEKAKTNGIKDYTNLLDEEKFILNAEEEMQERSEMILSATLQGKSKLLESISNKHKNKSTVVRFLKEMDQMVGSDLAKYGPFKAEDVATIPNENAQALIAKKIATKIRWED